MIHHLAVSKSQLREPNVVAAAHRGPVAVRGSADEELLYLVPNDFVVSGSEIAELTDVFLRLLVADRSGQLSSVLLGEVGFVSDWSPTARSRFIDGFTEALAESVRTRNAEPARAFIEIMRAGGGTAARGDGRSDGTVSPDMDAILRERVGARP